MRVLHVWDQSGVACVMTKYLRLSGVGSDVFKRKGFDPYGILGFYGHKEQSSMFGSVGFLRNAINMSKKYDIIHIHDVFRLVMPIKKMGKKVVLHYHGSILRNNDNRIGESHADQIFVSTPDLTDYCNDATYIPNPVDVEHFSIPSKTTDIMKPPESVQYSEIPEYISRHGMYHDIKHDASGNGLPMSLLGLQCLAQGLTVIHDGKEHVGLPQQHLPRNVMQDIMKTYDEIHNA